MYVVTNNSTIDIALPAANLGALVMAARSTTEVTDRHWNELEKSIYTETAIRRGYVSVEHKDDPPQPVKPDMRGVKAVSQSRGWWRVYVNGHEITDKAVRKSEAERIAAEYQ